MVAAILTIHLLLACALIVLVLLQRNEGGALGVGGTQNIMAGRSSVSGIARLTGWAVAAFFVTSMALAFLADRARESTLIPEAIDRPDGRIIEAPAPILPTPDPQ